MRRLLPLALVLLSGCGGAPAPTLAPGSTPAPQSTASAAPGATAGPAATTSPTSASGVVIPAKCAAGFIDYLKQIEPLVAAFDPSSATLGEFNAAADAVRDKGYEIMSANGSSATYSCSEVGLEFAYFDSRSPWAAIHEIAEANAPGTAAWLQVREQIALTDIAELEDLGVAGCDDAVARIKEAVAQSLASGSKSIEDLSVDQGVALLRLYGAYIADVRAEICPRDALGNDEFTFIR